VTTVNNGQCKKGEGKPSESRQGSFGNSVPPLFKGRKKKKKEEEAVDKDLGGIAR